MNENLGIEYSIIMPYWRRANLLKQTFDSFRLHYRERQDYEVIIVEDYKNQIDNSEHNALLELIDDYVELPIHLTLRPPEQTFNPCQHYNQGAHEASGKFVVITNPECKHITDVLQGLTETFSNNANCYIICACYDVNYPPYWYQHSIHNNRRLHFCASMSKQLFDNIGGFDENYKYGISYDDDDFIAKVEYRKIPVVCNDNLIVEHLSHEHFGNKYMDLVYKNKQYYETKWERTIHL